MSDVLISAESISKKFCRDLKKSLWYGVKDIAGEITGRKNPGNELRQGEFWSIDDVSFELKRGECLGLIGPNGAGKSTLLKMLNGLIKPDKGQIKIRGRIGALIELGAGFNPILTGRENIYVNGAVLGFSRKEIDQKFTEIVDFAELGDFIDTPVQNYSSGMKVRLGFAIAAQMDPDVLLIDEVLAVGDIGFRSRCFNAINKIQKKAAVIFVSHAMPDVNRICTDICVLSKGQVLFQGTEVPKGIECYFSAFKNEKDLLFDDGKVKVHSITLENNGKCNMDAISYLDELTIHIDATIDPLIKYPCIGIAFTNQALQIVAQSHSHYNDFKLSNNGKRMKISMNLGPINLNPGKYYLRLGVQEENLGKVLFRHDNFKALTVQGSFFGHAPTQINSKWSVEEIN
ncbi:MAG: ABC transporter ATP-binding protein [Desulfuromusa sp.]|nr:ABC transporter ATP-binding protein [Desulfuromusa sp.]